MCATALKYLTNSYKKKLFLNNFCQITKHPKKNKFCLHKRHLHISLQFQQKKIFFVHRVEKKNFGEISLDLVWQKCQAGFRHCLQHTVLKRPAQLVFEVTFLRLFNVIPLHACEIITTILKQLSAQPYLNKF